MTPTLSIVLGTLNRLPFLQRAIQSIPQAAGALTYEIIVVDGGSADGTLDWLHDEQIYFGTDTFRFALQEQRLGAVKAFTAGFHAAQGEYVAAFNDDAEYFGQPLENAVKLLRSDSAIGQVAIPFATQCVSSVSEIVSRNETPEVALVNLPTVGKVPYANFSVISKRLGDQLDYWGREFYQYAGDTHLSAKVWAAGKKVAPLPVAQGYLIHYEAQDETRVPNVEAPMFSTLWHQTKNPLNLQQTRNTKFVSNPTQLLKETHRAIPKPRPANTIRLRYVGKRFGNETYQRPGSPYKYVASARDCELDVYQEDVEWLLSRRVHHKILFEKI